MTLSMRARPRAGQTPWLGTLLIGSHLAVGGVEQPSRTYRIRSARSGMRWCHNQRSRPPAGQLQTLRRDLEELRRFYEFRDFAHFIEVYLAVVALIRTPQDIGYLTYDVAREMAVGQQLRYAELTCTPYTSVRPHENGVGMPIEAYTEALEDARVAAERDFGLVLRWIYDIPGEFGLPAADATLDYALHHRPEGLRFHRRAGSERPDRS
jgi:adenosine deaminase